MDAVFETILSFLSKGESQAMVLAMVIEFTLRLIPSQKPLSILYMVAKVAKISGDILSKFGALLDKVLPQNLK